MHVRTGTPPDTELRFACHWCHDEVVGDINGPELYGACDDCRRYARMSYDTLVDTARDLAAYNDFLLERVGWLEAGPGVQRSDESWPAGALDYDGGDA